MLQCHELLTGTSPNVTAHNYLEKFRAVKYLYCESQSLLIFSAIHIVLIQSFVVNLKRSTPCIYSSEASPTIWSCYANLNHYHYSFL